MIIGIDLGGTHLRIGAVNDKFEVENPVVVKTAIMANAENPLKKMCDLIAEYMNINKIDKIEAVSIGVPSSVANDKKTVICTTNIRNEKGEILFNNVNIAEDIEKYFNVPVFINNDVKNILEYDIENHNLNQDKVVAGIYIGTGVGASIVIDGKELDGINGTALDLGHMPYFNGTAQCSCGKTGCCECYASGWRLQEIRRKYYPDTKIEDMFVAHVDDKIMQDFVYACAYVYAVIATIFNPAAMVVGGGVMEMKGFPRHDFEKMVNELTGRDVMQYGFNFVYSQEFIGKGVIGAAIFARKRLNESI